jgi:hypothetical protein
MFYVGCSKAFQLYRRTPCWVPDINVGVSLTNTFIKLTSRRQCVAIYHCHQLLSSGKTWWSETRLITPFRWKRIARYGLHFRMQITTSIASRSCFEFTEDFLTFELLRVRYSGTLQLLVSRMFMVYHRPSWSCGQLSCFGFGRPRVQNSALVPAILSVILMGFLSYSRQLPE